MLQGWLTIAFFIRFFKIHSEQRRTFYTNIEETQVNCKFLSSRKGSFVMFRKYFTNYLKWLVLIMIIFILHVTLVPIFNVATIFFSFLMIFMLQRVSSKLIGKGDAKTALVYILLLAGILRLVWVLFIPTMPISDFELMYSYAQQVQQGDFGGVFDNFEYFARFAHDTITVLFFSVFYNLTANPLLLIKLCNVLFSTLSFICSRL